MYTSHLINLSGLRGKPYNASGVAGLERGRQEKINTDSKSRKQALHHSTDSLGK